MHQERKLGHIKVSLEEDVSFKESSTGLEHYRFVHRALPEIDFNNIDLSLTFLGKRMSAPLIISGMTGGPESLGQINRNLAMAAQELGIGIGVGSQRAAILDSRLEDSFQVRKVAKEALLLANLGAVQLNTGFGIGECKRAVDMIEADALVLHLNPLQECLQENGNTNFEGLLDKIASICATLPVPVIVKEVGWGISDEVARLLVSAGVKAIDTAGAGGTNWAEVEKHLTKSETVRKAAESFATWGIPTSESIVSCRKVLPDIALIGSGGIRTGVDAAKAVALGADAVAMAQPLLKPATQSSDAVVEILVRVLLELRISMLCVGAQNLGRLREAKIEKMV